MLETAVHLLDQANHAPMQGEGRSLLHSPSHGSDFYEQRKKLVRRGADHGMYPGQVVLSKNRLENEWNPTYRELDDLYKRIDRMDEILKEGSAREIRIRNIFRSKSGRDEPQVGDSLMWAYLAWSMM